MGEDCSKPCVHGKVDGPSCVCDPCYTGAGCELECSGNGRCVNDTCDCFSTVIGTNCHQKFYSHIHNIFMVFKFFSFKKE